LKNPKSPLPQKNFTCFFNRCCNIGLSLRQAIGEAIIIIKEFIPEIAPIHASDSYPSIQDITNPRLSGIGVDEIIQERITYPFENLDKHFDKILDSLRTENSAINVQQESEENGYLEPNCFHRTNNEIAIMVQQMVPFPIVAPLPKFGDQVNQNLSDFVIDFENFLEQNYITSEELKIKTLISALTTGAPRQQILRRIYGKKWSRWGEKLQKSFGRFKTGLW